MTFRVGMKVVCVNDKGYVGISLDQPDRPRRDQVYTIRDVILHDSEVFVRVEEIVCDPETHPVHGEGGWAAWRFRPVVERKTSIELFHQIRRDVENNVPAELVGERA